MSITTMAKHLCLFMMITGALTACSGDPSKAAAAVPLAAVPVGTLNPVHRAVHLPVSHLRPAVLPPANHPAAAPPAAASARPITNQSAPVEPQNLQCIKAPCPTGVYKTYSNQCASDLAKAKFISNGECGDLEGKPYIEELTACTAQYDPVCAAATDIAPCKTIPCPARLYKTFGNACEASVAKAGVIQKVNVAP